MGNASASASANGGATHAGVYVIGGGLSRLEHVNGQHNRLANAMQNANGRKGVIN